MEPSRDPRRRWRKVLALQALQAVRQRAGRAAGDAMRSKGSIGRLGWFVGVGRSSDLTLGSRGAAVPSQSKDNGRLQGQNCPNQVVEDYRIPQDRNSEEGARMHSARREAHGCWDGYQDRAGSKDRNAEGARRRVSRWTEIDSPDRQPAARRTFVGSFFTSSRSACAVRACVRLCRIVTR